MPPKKDKKANDADDADPGLNPAVFLNNYTRYCKQTCVSPNQKIVDMFSNDEWTVQFVNNRQLVLDDEKGALGPGGTRALCSAIMGTGQGMANTPCKLFKSLRLWRVDIRDDGAACIAELLRLGGAEVTIVYLELLDNNIGPPGARYLGQSLMYGQNRSLRTLKLDYNLKLGSEGVAALCQGLRTNSTLKQLHLPYCNVGPEGGAPLGEMLSYRQSTLEVLNLQGNRLCGKGVSDLSNGLAMNQSLTALSLADNGIGQSDEDNAAIKKLGSVIVLKENPLANIDLLYNCIGQKGGEALLDTFNGKAPNKVRQLLIDSTLPQHLFDNLCRIEVRLASSTIKKRDESAISQAAGGSKKKKKGKKKKK